MGIASRLFMNNFMLSDKLSLFLKIEAGFQFPYLGEKLPVSIQQRYSISQSIRIFPERDYSFFSLSEIQRIEWIVKSLELSLAIRSYRNVPVIEITEYFNNLS